MGGQHHTPAALPWERHRILCIGGWVAPGPVRTGAENLVPQGYDPQTIQPVASRYTDWAILAVKGRWLLYILVSYTLKLHFSAAIQGWAVVCSVISVAWSLTSYHRSVRYARDDKEKLEWQGAVMQFCWHLMSTGNIYLNKLCMYIWTEVEARLSCKHLGHFQNVQIEQ